MKINTIQLNQNYYKPGKTTATIAFKNNTQGQAATPTSSAEAPQFKQSLKETSASPFERIINQVKDFFYLEKPNPEEFDLNDYIANRAFLL
jgi:hypothetical protein